MSEKQQKEEIKNIDLKEVTKDKEQKAEAQKGHKKTQKTTKKKSPKKTTKKMSKAEEFEAKYNEMNDKYLRLYSEFDNYRKRTLKEKLELNKTAAEEIILSLLPVLDDCERAKKIIEETDNTTNFKEGLELITKKFLNILKQKGLKEIDALNKEFDTDYHEAVTKIPAPSKKLKGKNVDVIEKGYMLNGKVIRYAKVVIGE
ncbi:MAG: nucleotide exchange factor GrpE [Bacteroidales bacterium]|nr:nucleotide exchange factor GrpE [Bacteroidales bacterium]